uniref:Uncharacterized protein n=1 Tax=Vitis vinifera TaxID=29760 RepID=F6HVT0_VITVI
MFRQDQSRANTNRVVGTL